MCVKEFEKIITSHRLSKEQALVAVEKVFDDKKALLKKLLWVNKDLKVVPNMDQAKAVVALVQKNAQIAESWFLKDVFFDRFHFKKGFINIAFLEPIGHDATLRESILLTQEWLKTHYPQYHATLISCFFSVLAEKCGLDAFYDCWLREFESDGWPQYRNYPTSACRRIVEGYEKQPNVYASLVMTKEEFEKLNPDVNGAKYYSEV